MPGLDPARRRTPQAACREEGRIPGVSATLPTRPPLLAFRVGSHTGDFRRGSMLAVTPHSGVADGPAGACAQASQCLDLEHQGGAVVARIDLHRDSLAAAAVAQVGFVHAG
jgi:hypothetical protein